MVVLAVAGLFCVPGMFDDLEVRVAATVCEDLPVPIVLAKTVSQKH